MSRLKTRTSEVDASIGLRVKRARVESGVSQDNLAASLGVTFQQVQKYENGRTRISASALLLIAEALSVPVLDLLCADARTAALPEVDEVA